MELFPTKSTTAAETASMILNHVGRFGSPEVIHSDQVPAFHNKLVTELVVEENNLLPRHILARRIVSLSVLIKRCYDIFVSYSLIAASTISGHLNSFH